MKIKDIVVVEIMIRVRLHWSGIKDSLLSGMSSDDIIPTWAACMECAGMINDTQPLVSQAVLYYVETWDWELYAQELHFNKNSKNARTLQLPLVSQAVLYYAMLRKVIWDLELYAQELQNYSHSKNARTLQFWVIKPPLYTLSCVWNTY